MIDCQKRQKGLLSQFPQIKGGSTYLFSIVFIPITMKICSLLLVLPFASAASYCPSRAATPQEQTAIFREFIHKFYINRDVPSAFGDHFDRGIIEHNPNALSGWNETSIGGLAGFIATTNFTILNSGFSDNRGYVHFREERADALPTAVVDVLRFNGSCIVEHWDVAQVSRTLLGGNVIYTRVLEKEILIKNGWSIIQDNFFSKSF